MVPKSVLLENLSQTCTKNSATDSQKKLLDGLLYTEFQRRCASVNGAYLARLQDLERSAPCAVKEGVEFGSLHSFTDVNHFLNSMTGGVTSADDVKRVTMEFQPFLDSCERLKEWLKTSA